VDYVNDKSQSDSLMWQESLSPSKVRRHEWGLIFSRHGRVSDHTDIQHGFCANDALVREDAREWKTWELKYQLLFDFNLNPNTRLGVNTTWDLDQVMRNFPYSKKAPFRPWAGETCSLRCIYAPVATREKNIYFQKEKHTCEHKDL